MGDLQHTPVRIAPNRHFIPLNKTLSQSALIDRVPLTLWREFALPLCPLSLITFWALTRTEGRAAAVAVLLACAPYIALSALILGVSEHGAYLAALAAPMSLLAARVVPPKALIAITAAAWTCSAWLTWSHDTEGARYRDFAAGFQRLAGADPALLLYCEDPIPGADAHVGGSRRSQPLQAHALRRRREQSERCQLVDVRGGAFEIIL